MESHLIFQVLGGGTGSWRGEEAGLHPGLAGLAGFLCLTASVLLILTLWFYRAQGDHCWPGQCREDHHPLPVVSIPIPSSPIQSQTASQMAEQGDDVFLPNPPAAEPPPAGSKWSE